MTTALLRQTPWVIGNWKMNPNSMVQAIELALACAEYSIEGVHVGVTPSHLHLAAVATQLCDHDLQLVAQDLAVVQGTGAYTGDVSGQMLAALGVSWVLVGHSERRQYHAESDAILTQKIQAALQAGLRVVLCVGEQLTERQTGQAEAVVLAQLHAQLSHIDPVVWQHHIIVAYEPVWAIGTGQTASPEDAQAMHAAIRMYLGQQDSRLEHTPILYGGSVKADNAASLAACPDIDGALVGGAALNADSFLKIAEAFAQAKRA
jgi:triosephosphate isomerase (TIM)